MKFYFTFCSLEQLHNPIYDFVIQFYFPFNYEIRVYRFVTNTKTNMTKNITTSIKPDGQSNEY